MATALKIILLGGFDAQLDGSSVDGFSYKKMRALLAYLAMEQGKDHSREFLSELFWGDNSPETARDNLRRALSKLRKILEAPTGQTLFASTRHSLRFNPTIYVDALKFTELIPTSQNNSDAGLQHKENLIALYRGEFLKGFSLPNCRDFDDWVQVQREALHLRALALLEQVSLHYQTIGDYSTALSYVLRRTVLEPWDEEAHRSAMSLYSLNGQNRAAIKQYEICCRVLKNQLGILPDQKTRQLAEQISNGILPRRSTDIPAQAPRSHTIPASQQERRSTDHRKPQSLVAKERRQVSVMYCELIIPTIDDPDDALELIGPAQAHCAEIIMEFCGHTLPTHGGGMLTYFGYPKASEHAAHRAVQAALAITRDSTLNFEIRASVHTGLIVTGGYSSMPDITGRTSRLAIQLRRITGRNKVTISKDTYDIVSGHFDCTRLSAQYLPDFGQVVEIFKVARETGARLRFETGARLTPLIGRKAEVAELMRLWAQAEQGERHVVLVQGEAGIGKSRLLHRIKKRLTGRPHVIREFRCFPEFSQSPFHPLIAMFEANMGFEPEDTPELKSGKVSNYVQTYYPSSAQDAVPILCNLLSLTPPEHYRSAALSPQIQKEKTIAVLLALLHARSQQALLFIVEDLHWIDPSTLEFLTQLVERQTTESVLAIFTARPEFNPPWRNIHLSALTLGPLSMNEAIRMTASLSADLSPDTLQRIVKRADGIPLFIEEIVKITALGNQSYLPKTLHDLLAARVDNLGQSKFTAQLASIIGREFNLDLLRKISLCNHSTLDIYLCELQEAGLILNINESSRQFKHALIQEAAYHSQTKSVRQAVHQRIAQVLQSDFSDVVATQPEILAQHLSAGGEIQQAIEYWIKAGQRAARNSANLEAIEHFNAGLQLLMRTPSGPDRDKMEFNILVSLCLVLHAVKGYGSEDARQLNARIAALSGTVGDSPELFQAKWSLVMNTIANAGSRDVSEPAMQLLTMAENDPLRKQAAHYIVAKSCFWLGRFEATHSHTEQALALYHPAQLPMLLEQFGEDLSVSSGSYLFWALYFLGFPDRAQQVCARTLEQARELGHPHTLGLALCTASLLYRSLNKPTQVLALSAEAIALSQQHGFPVWLAVGEMTHGWALVMLGQQEGITKLKSSITGMRTALSGISVVFLSALIEAYVHLKQPNEALELIAEALAETVSTGDGHFSAELHRLKGVCLLETPEPNSEQAEACFSQAIAISRKQRAQSLELRAVISMARLWCHQDKSEAARNMLADIYNKFTEGLDSPDLQEAADLIRHE